MKIVDLVRRKKQRIDGPGVPALPTDPVVPQSATPIEVVDVEPEPNTASPSQVPPATEPAGVESSLPPRTVAKPKSCSQGKDPLGVGIRPLVIFPEVHKGTSDEEHQELVRHYEARVVDGEETRRVIGDYFAEVAPSKEKGAASRADLESFFRGRVGERVVPLLSELDQGMIKGMCDIPLRNLARNGTYNEVSLSSAALLSSLRVRYSTLFLTLLCLN